MAKAKGVQHNYEWEAETADGKIIKVGGGLKGCVRVSLIPHEEPYSIGAKPTADASYVYVTPAPVLPRHDFKGLKFVRRFGRGFLGRSMNRPGDGTEYLHCIVCEDKRIWVKSSDGSVTTTKADVEVCL